jgi:uncharacterized protein YkwD
MSILVIGFSFFNRNSWNQDVYGYNYFYSQIILEINKVRKQKNLPGLSLNHNLKQAAQEKAVDMAKERYFSHISPINGKKWSDFIKESGYQYLEAGENLANGYSTTDEMVNAWMNSPSHKKNILSKTVDETGIGVYQGYLGGHKTTFVVQVFGRREKVDQVLKIVNT